MFGNETFAMKLAESAAACSLVNHLEKRIIITQHMGVISDPHAGRGRRPALPTGANLS